jgi:hypothetical protein
MRRIFVLSLVWLAAGVVTACDDVEKVVETEGIPMAGVRFVNAVPDTGSMDFRFIDIPESNAHWDTPFRNNIVTTSGVPASTKVQYKAARAGDRQFRIFMYGTTIPVASTVVHEGTHTFEANKNYTVLIWGYANPSGPGRPAGAPALQVTIFEEAVADPGEDVALRVINASMDAVDVSQYEDGGTLPGSATWAAVPAMSISDYVTATPDRIRYNVKPAGGATDLFDDPLALLGAPAGSFDVLPGTTVPGSAVTAIVFPGSVVGSQAPQTGSFIVTTGSTAMSATATGYERPAGSFLDEGFAVGQTVTASGFANAANNGQSVITSVDDNTMTVTKTPATVVEATNTSRSLIGPPRPAISFIWDRRPPRPPGT